MSLFQEFATRASEASLPVLLAVMGGVARLLSTSPDKVPSLWKIFHSAFLAAFTGAVAWAFVGEIEHESLTEGMKAGLVAMSGYLNVQLLELLGSKMMRIAEKRCNEVPPHVNKNRRKDD